MYLKYGNYSHDVGECQISISRQSEFNDAKDRWAIRERWDVQGQLNNPTGDLSTMKTLCDSLVNAYAYGGFNLVLYTPAHAATTHALYSSNCMGGTMVVQPVSFPTGEGAEGITYRNYTLSVEGLLITDEARLLSFNESLTFAGGGPQYGHLETLIGLPVKQLLRRNSVFKATQQGSAVGILSYPSIPAPIWPSAMVGNLQEERGMPKRHRNDYAEYPLNWRYEFESAYPLLGNPNFWTRSRR